MTESTKTARILYDFQGRDDELSVHKDDIVLILEEDFELGWSKVRMDDKVGLLPDNCFKLMPASELQGEKVRW